MLNKDITIIIITVIYQLASSKQTQGHRKCTIWAETKHKIVIKDELLNQL